MSRSKWKGLHFDFSTYHDIFETKRGGIRIYSRNSVIPKEAIDKVLFVHTGKNCRQVRVDRERVGFQFGYFCSTRKKHVYKKILTKKKSGSKIKSNNDPKKKK
jgi:ribosomal protein S19